MNSDAVVVGVVTAILTLFGTQIKGKYDIKRQKIESGTNTEGMYVQNMSVILEEYKEQVSGFRDEVKKLRDENAEIKKEFDTFKQSHYQKIEEYKKYVDLLEIENEELKEENTDLKHEIVFLKEGLNGNITK